MFSLSKVDIFKMFYTSLKLHSLIKQTTQIYWTIIYVDIN